MEFSASMMCADFGCLRDEVKALDEAGIDKYHIDIMDGMFVPNLGMGLQDIKCIRSLTDKTIEAHLMVCKVNSYIDILAAAGVNTVFFHPEADYHPFTTLQRIIDLGMTPGIVYRSGNFCRNCQGTLQRQQGYSSDGSNTGLRRTELPAVCRRENKGSSRHEIPIRSAHFLGRLVHSGKDSRIFPYRC